MLQGSESNSNIIVISQEMERVVSCDRVFEQRNYTISIYEKGGWKSQADGECEAPDIKCVGRSGERMIKKNVIPSHSKLMKSISKVSVTGNKQIFWLILFTCSLSICVVAVPM